MTHLTAMGHRLASDAKGVESIVREHYRKHYGPVSIAIDIDMERLKATVSMLDCKIDSMLDSMLDCKIVCKIVCSIEKFFLDKRPLYCILILEKEE